MELFRLLQMNTISGESFKVVDFFKRLLTNPGGYTK